MTTVAIVLAAALGSTQHAPPSMRFATSRRAVLAAAPYAFWTAAAHAEDEDKLVTRLIEVREKLSATGPALAADECDAVRGTVKTALSPLTLKGYLGGAHACRL